MKLKITKMRNGFICENEKGTFVYNDALEITKQMAKDIDLIPLWKMMVIEYVKHDND
jgi:hypothetical protein